MHEVLHSRHTASSARRIDAAAESRGPDGNNGHTSTTAEAHSAPIAPPKHVAEQLTSKVTKASRLLAEMSGASPAPSMDTAAGASGPLAASVRRGSAVYDASQTIVAVRACVSGPAATVAPPPRGLPTPFRFCPVEGKLFVSNPGTRIHSPHTDDGGDASGLAPRALAVDYFFDVATSPSDIGTAIIPRALHDAIRQRPTVIVAHGSPHLGKTALLFTSADSLARNYVTQLFFELTKSHLADFYAVKVSAVDVVGTNVRDLLAPGRPVINVAVPSGGTVPGGAALASIVASVGEFDSLITQAFRRDATVVDLPRSVSERTRSSSAVSDVATNVLPMHRDARASPSQIVVTVSAGPHGESPCGDSVPRDSSPFNALARSLAKVSFVELGANMGHTAPGALAAPTLPSKEQHQLQVATRSALRGAQTLFAVIGGLLKLAASRFAIDPAHRPHLTAAALTSAVARQVPFFESSLTSLLATDLVTGRCWLLAHCDASAPAVGSASDEPILPRAALSTLEIVSRVLAEKFPHGSPQADYRSAAFSQQARAKRAEDALESLRLDTGAEIHRLRHDKVALHQAFEALQARAAAGSSPLPSVPYSASRRSGGQLSGPPSDAGGTVGRSSAADFSALTTDRLAAPDRLATLQSALVASQREVRDLQRQMRLQMHEYYAPVHADRAVVSGCDSAAHRIVAALVAAEVLPPGSTPESSLVNLVALLAAKDQLLSAVLRAEIRRHGADVASGSALLLHHGGEGLVQQGLEDASPGAPMHWQRWFEIMRDLSDVADVAQHPALAAVATASREGRAAPFLHAWTAKAIRKGHSREGETDGHSPNHALKSRRPSTALPAPSPS